MGPRRLGLVYARSGRAARGGDPQGPRGREAPRRRGLRMRCDCDDHAVPAAADGLRRDRHQRAGGRTLPRSRSRAARGESRGPLVDCARGPCGPGHRPRWRRRSHGRGRPRRTIRRRRHAPGPLRPRRSPTRPRRARRRIDGPRRSPSEGDDLAHAGRRRLRCRGAEASRSRLRRRALRDLDLSEGHAVSGWRLRRGPSRHDGCGPPTRRDGPGSPAVSRPSRIGRVRSVETQGDRIPTRRGPAGTRRARQHRRWMAAPVRWRLVARPFLRDRAEDSPDRRVAGSDQSKRDIFRGPIERERCHRMKAVVLAAGEGTRMRPLTANLPKPLLPVAGKPFLRHTLEALRSAGISQVAVLIGWQGHRIRESLGDGEVTGLEEKPRRPKSNLINAGIYIFDEDIFPLIDKTPKSPRGEYEITDTIRALMEQRDVYGFRLPGEWIDVGRPWDLLRANAALLAPLKGANHADVDGGATLVGEVLVEAGARVRRGAYIEGPTVIGPGAEIGPNCYIRPSTSIGAKAKVGNACEVKNSILMAGTHVPHQNYVGDSILGERCNLGAGTKVANLRLDEAPIRVVWRGTEVDTGLRKLGVIMGDDVKVGINASIDAGTIIGEESFLGPGSHARGNIAPRSRIF